MYFLKPKYQTQILWFNIKDFNSHHIQIGDGEPHVKGIILTPLYYFFFCNLYKY